MNSPVANSVMHWRIGTFLDVSAALLYTVDCNQANALILVEKFGYTYVFSQREVSFWLLRWRRIYIMCTRRWRLLGIHCKLCCTVRKQLWVNLTRVAQFWRTVIEENYLEIYSKFPAYTELHKGRLDQYLVNWRNQTFYLLHFDCVNYGRLYIFIFYL